VGRSGRFGEKKNLFLLFEMKSRLPGRPPIPVPQTEADNGPGQDPIKYA